jgi:formylmethanofuran dehydrogenase subunit E
MDIERLKEISECGRELYMLNDENLIERIRENNQLQNYLSDSIDAIDEAIARQSVKSEDVAEAIKLFESSLKYRKDQEEEIKKQYGGEMPNFLLQVNQKELLAIAALQAYQTVAISKMETTTPKQVIKQFHCSVCGEGYYKPTSSNPCPCCGRRL